MGVKTRSFFQTWALMGLLVISVPAWGASALSVTPTRDIPSGELNMTPANAEYMASSGSYSYRVKLDVLPAHNDHVPNIDLVYSPSKANGFLGAGWSFAFESRMERVGPNRGTATMTSDDLFLIDGQELIKRSDGTYRTRMKDFGVYEPIYRTYGGKSVLIGWEVRKNGYKTTYGWHTWTDYSNSVLFRDASISGGQATGTVPVGWLISRSEDPYQNQIFYRYDDGGEGSCKFSHRPESIRYDTWFTGITAEVPETTHQISFVYQSRDDNRETFNNGVERDVCSLVNEITVSRESPPSDACIGCSPTETLTHAYLLDYFGETNGVQSLLKKVHRAPISGSDTIESGDKHQLASFEYEDEKTSWNVPDGAAPTLDLVGSTDTAHPNAEEMAGLGTDAVMGTENLFLMSFVTFADINGDSRTDFIAFNDICRQIDLAHTNCPIKNDNTATVPGPDGEMDADDFEAPECLGSEPEPGYDCIWEHRVFLHEWVSFEADVLPDDAKSAQFVYDSDLSAEVNAFFQRMHNADGSLRGYLITDLNRDGRTDLIRDDYVNSVPPGEDECDPDDLAPGLSDGECLLDQDARVAFGQKSGAATTWKVAEKTLSEFLPLGDDDEVIPVSSFFEKYHLSDWNGDGYPDLLGMEKVYLHTGEKNLEFGEEISLNNATVEEPIVFEGEFKSFNSSDVLESCLPGLSEISLDEFTETFCLISERSYLKNDSGGGVDCENFAPIDCLPDTNDISKEEWLWRHTFHADFNGDGVLDRLIAAPKLVCSDGDWCAPFPEEVGQFNQLLLGDGVETFSNAGYGVGTPPATNWITQDRTTWTTSTVGVAKQLLMGLGTYRFEYPLNHLAMGDVDGSGRMEVIQRCGSSDGLYAISHQGSDDGWGLEIDGDCPASDYQSGEVPGGMFGASFLDMHNATLMDVDLDGFLDVVTYAADAEATGEFSGTFVNSSDNAPWMDGSFCGVGGSCEGWEGAGEDGAGGLRWFRNERTNTQNRLKKITLPHGGTIALTWDRSARGDNQMPLNMPVLREIEDGEGTHQYRFSRGRYSDGEMLGFRRAEMTHPNGSGTVKRFYNNRVMQGLPISEARYDDLGFLSHMRVFAYADCKGGAGCLNGVDWVAPYFNPPTRVCEYDLGSQNPAGLGAIGLMGNFVDPCRDLPYDLQLTGLEILGTGAEQVLQGADPFVVGGAESEDDLVLFERATLGDSAAAAEILASGSLYSWGGIASFFDFDASPPLVTTVERLLPSDWQEGGSAPAFNQEPTVTADSDIRTYMKEWDYNRKSGEVIFERDRRNFDFVEDDLLSYFDHSVWDVDYGGVRLKSVKRYDAMGTRLEWMKFTNYKGDRWQQKKEMANSVSLEDLVFGVTPFADCVFDADTCLDALSASPLDSVGSCWICSPSAADASAGGDSWPARTETRLYDLRGELYEETDAEGVLTTHSSYGCGTLSTQYATGIETQWDYDATCRLEKEEDIGSDDSLRFVTTYVRDGFGRVISEQSNAKASGAEPISLEKIPTQYAYDYDAPSGNPNKVTFYPQPDGSTTQLRHFVDGHGRKVKETRCAVGEGSETGSLKAQFPCDTSDGDPIVVNEWVYYTNTGETALVVGPYEYESGVTPSFTDVPMIRYDYDGFGRRVQERHPEGRENTYSYGLGYRQVHEFGEANEVITQVAVDTLSKSWSINAIFRGSIHRDAFGREVMRKDAAGEFGFTYYDGYNRATDVLLPEVEVLQSGKDWLLDVSPLLSTSYDKADRKTEEVDPNGNLIEYEYDASGRLAKTIGEDIGGKLEDVWNYTDLGYSLETVTDARGQIRATFKDGLERLYREVATDLSETLITYDSRGRVASRTQPWGAIHTYEYDGLGRMISETTTYEDASTGQTIDATKTITYDVRGNVLSTEDADGVVTENTYDLENRLLTVHMGAGGAMREVGEFQYDDFGRQIKARENGVITEKTYDDFNRVTDEKRGCESWTSCANPLITQSFEYDLMDRVKLTVDGEGHKHETTYDALGRVLAIETREKLSSGGYKSLGVRTFDYDAQGNSTREIDEEGVESRKEYDAYHRESARTTAGIGWTDTFYSDDTENGLLVFNLVAPTGETSSSYLDGEGREVYRHTPDGLWTGVEFENTLAVRSHRWNEDWPSVTDLAGKDPAATKHLEHHPGTPWVYRDWDWMSEGESGSVSGINNPCPSGLWGCTTASTLKTYTDAGRIQSVTDSAGNTATYDYEATSGLLTEIAYPGMGETSFVYDDDYPLLKQTTRADSTGSAADITQDLDYHNRLHLISVERAQGGLSEFIWYVYDQNGQRTASGMVREGALVGYPDASEPLPNYSLLHVMDYDGAGRMTSRETSLGTTPDDMVVQGALQWAYRQNGQISEVTYPTGHKATYTYYWFTALLSSVDLENESGGWLGNAAYLGAYDLSGRARYLSLATDSARMYRVFDTEKGREDKRYLKGVSPTWRRELFSYDTLGRLESIQAKHLGYGASSTTQYEYNARDFLIQEDLHRGSTVAMSTQYEYDDTTGLRSGVNNTLYGSSVGSSAYEYGVGNQLTSVDGESVVWDGFGRELLDQRKQYFNYGPASQVLALGKVGSPPTEWMMHDAEGLRVARVTSAGVHLYLTGQSPDDLLYHDDPDMGEELYLRLPTGTVVGIYDVGTGDMKPVIRDITGSPYRIGAYSDDHQYVYQTAFGDVLSEWGGFYSELSFHQMFASEAEGVRTAGVRNYDTETGRFLSPDPLTFSSSADINDAADFYRYALHNPVHVTDATGYNPKINPSSACQMAARGGCVPGTTGGGMVDNASEMLLEHSASAKKREAKRLQRGIAFDQVSREEMGSMTAYKMDPPTGEEGPRQEEESTAETGTKEIQKEKRRYRKALRRGKKFRKPVLGTTDSEDDLDVDQDLPSTDDLDLGADSLLDSEGEVDKEQPGKIWSFWDGLVELEQEEDITNSNSAQVGGEYVAGKITLTFNVGPVSLGGVVQAGSARGVVQGGLPNIPGQQMPGGIVGFCVICPSAFGEVDVPDGGSVGFRVDLPGDGWTMGAAAPVYPTETGEIRSEIELQVGPTGGMIFMTTPDSSVQQLQQGMIESKARQSSQNQFHQDARDLQNQSMSR